MTAADDIRAATEHAVAMRKAIQDAAAQLQSQREQSANSANPQQ